MNADSPGSRDGYSQNPSTVRQGKSTDDALLDFSKKVGGTLISPSGPTWRRGDDTQSVTLDHVFLVNFPGTEAKETAETLGDIQHDHLCLQIGLDVMVFGEWAPHNPPTAPTRSTWTVTKSLRSGRTGRCQKWTTSFRCKRGKTIPRSGRSRGGLSWKKSTV